jgi:hypothetical protein
VSLPCGLDRLAIGKIRLVRCFNGGRQASPPNIDVRLGKTSSKPRSASLEHNFPKVWDFVAKVCVVGIFCRGPL